MHVFPKKTKKTKLQQKSISCDFHFSTSFEQLPIKLCENFTMHKPTTAPKLFGIRSLKQELCEKHIFANLCF